MILDYNLQFSDAQECLSTANSTNVIDTEMSITTAAASNLGPGTPLWVHVKVNTAFAIATSTSTGGYYILQDCATSGGTYEALWQTQDYSSGVYAAGYDILTIPLPNEHKRYLRGRWVSSGASCSAGKIDSFITFGAPRA